MSAMCNKEIIDGFFSHPRYAPDQRQPYGERPHTPSHRVAIESQTAMNANGNSYESENDPSHLRNGGQTASDSLCLNDKHNNPIPIANLDIQGNMHSKGNGNYSDPNQRLSPTMATLYTNSLRPQQEQQQQQHMPKGAMHLQESGLLSDVHLQQFVTCLTECKVMATHLLQIAQVSLAHASPVLTVLPPIVSHLDTDLNQLMALRSTLLTSAMTTRAINGDYYPSAPNVETRDTLLSHAMMSTPTKKQQQPQQQQQQQHSQEYNQSCVDGKGTRVGGEMSTLYDRSGIWCTPEARGRPLAESDSNAAATTVSVATAASSLPSFHAAQGQAQPSSSFDTAEEGFDNNDTTSVVEETQERQSYHTAGAMAPVAPVAAAAAAADPPSWDKSKFLAFVEFKRKRVRKYECNVNISPGKFVIVDGDRGQDCGLIVQTIKTEPDGTTVISCMDYANINADKIKLEKGRVLGAASNEEIDRLHNSIPFAERVALETCKKMCNHMGITIQLLDCEYQFDMEKLSFYFNSEHSVDFRPLVRELYRTFHVRIWMENTNPNVKNAMPITDSSAVGNSGGNNNNNNNNNHNDEVRGDAASSNGYNYNHSNNKHAGAGGGRDGSIAARNGAGGRGGGRGRRSRNKA